MRYKLFHVFLILIIPFVLHAQSNHYELDGFIHVKNGETYPYQLLISVRGSSIHGYSITKLADGTEPKITLKGHIERDKHTITINEKKLISELPQNTSTCLVNAVLTYTAGKSKYPLSGTFTSNDIDNKPCGKGTIEFTNSGYISEIFKDDTPVVKKAPEYEVQETQTGEYEITNGITKQFEWHSDTCNFEIYDGGIIDGDEVSVIFNGQNVLTNYVLAKQKKLVKLLLNKGKNTITILAEYEGKVPPNTANVIISDGNRRYKIKAFNYAGDKANIIINKK